MTSCDPSNWPYLMGQDLIVIEEYKIFIYYCENTYNL